MPQWSKDISQSTGNNGPHLTETTPSLASFNGKLYCVHPSTTLERNLWYSSFDGQTWSQEDTLNSGYNGEHKSGFPVGLVEFQGLLYCVYRSADLSFNLYYATFDGSSWSPDRTLSDDTHTSTAGPGVAVYGNKLYCVHKGGFFDANIYYCYFDGTTWSKDQLLQDSTNGTHKCDYAPAVATYQGKLICVHRGTNSSTLWYSTFDGQSWSADMQLSNGGNGLHESADSPALAVYGDLLYCLHRGNSLDTGLWYCTFDGSAWSEDKQLSDGQNGLHLSNTAPALGVLNGGALYCAHSGSTWDTQIYYCSYR